MSATDRAACYRSSMAMHVRALERITYSRRLRDHRDVVAAASASVR